MMQTKSREALLPPCTAACPVGTDARRYAGLIFQGRYEEALEVIKANNVIPSVCAYICAHPCEDACRRQYVEGPLAIRALKRFVMDHTREYRRRLYQRAALTRPQRVAIVGSGPEYLPPGSSWRGRSLPDPRWPLRPRPAAGEPQGPSTISCAPVGI